MSEQDICANRHRGNEQSKEAFQDIESAVSGRFSELKAGGLIEQIGRRPTPTGSSAGVYRTLLITREPIALDFFDRFREEYEPNPYDGTGGE